MFRFHSIVFDSSNVRQLSTLSVVMRVADAAGAPELAGAAGMISCWQRRVVVMADHVMLVAGTR
jgi:hypothetical protein